jgi:tmRNA-binding protein
MKYEIKEGKVINIPDNEIKKLMQKLSISQIDAIELWLDDNGFMVNQEQMELDEKASKVKIDTGAKKGKKRDTKPREIKVSDEKRELFNYILNSLKNEYGANAKVLNENKLISLTIGEKTFKIDLIEQRKPKK